MKYTLIAIIDKDRRQIDFDDCWGVFTGAHDLLQKSLGYPERITYGGYTIACEDEMAIFDKKLNKILRLGSSPVKIKNLQKLTLKRVRERVVPK